MSNRTEPSGAEAERDDAPQILRRAAIVIETRGWHQGDFFDYEAHFDAGRPLEECGVCVRGALNIAAGFDPTGTTHGDDARDDVIDALALYLGCDLDEDVPPDFVTAWNDTEAVSAEQVTTALRECAAELSKETTR